MKIFLAGATGVIGSQLVPMLLDAGHEVTGTTRSPERAERLRASGAAAVVLDALDERAVRAAVCEAAPQAVIHQLTSLPRRIDPRRMERDFALNDRLRDEGTRILAGAAREAGAERFLAQSVAFSYAPGAPGTLHDEADPLLGAGDTPPSFRRTALALRALERHVAEIGGLTLRYGYFYGGGSAISSTGSMVEDVCRRRLPIIGGGRGVWSFIHVHDGAAATLAALGRGGPGAYNIVDDEPAAVAEWLPALAGAVGAKQPLRLPALIARPLAGEYGVATMTRAQGASNARAKRELGWEPEHPSWRRGFAAALG
jgi:nucleoside-diphosphate-sugar epimerase